jgi:hypothetical protein
MSKERQKKREGKDKKRKKLEFGEQIEAGFPEPQALIYALRLVSEERLNQEQREGLNTAFFIISQEMEARQLLGSFNEVTQIYERCTMLEDEYADSDDRDEEEAFSLLDLDSLVHKPVSLLSLIQNPWQAYELIEKRLDILEGRSIDRDADDRDFNGMKADFIPR